MDKNFSKEQGDLLLKLAIKTIEKKLGIESSPIDESSLESELKKAVFDERRGVFVTLHKNKQLRGCIGSLESEESIRDGVEDNSINAAFKDPRFSKLVKEELDQIDIEVSILSKPEKLEYSSGKDLISKLSPGVDGVIIKKGWSRATFLPQVWDQLPETEDFLAHLCRKAGLSKNEWEKGELEVMTYQVQYFEE